MATRSPASVVIISGLFLDSGHCLNVLYFSQFKLLNHTVRKMLLPTSFSWPHRYIGISGVCFSLLLLLFLRTLEVESDEAVPKQRKTLVEIWRGSPFLD